MKKQTKLYNVFFPIWMLYLFPPVILISLAVNFIIDYLVIRLSLKKQNIGNYKEISKEKIFKTWIFGFVSDIVGSAFLFILAFYFLNDIPGNFMNNVLNSVAANPFGNILAFLITSTAIFISGILIYYFNKNFVFKNSSLDEEVVKKLCFHLAIFTAPYFFLFPISIFF